MLTKDDIKAIRDLVEEKTRFLPTKDDFFTKMDEIMGELKAIREEQMLQSGRISEHSDQLEEHAERIEKVEKSTMSSTPL